jgi:uncharacterized protein (TIGR03083 family)
MTIPETFDVQAAVGAEFDRLAGELGARGERAWDRPSLCAGWRVREVVAHMTMAVRYPPAEFQAELQASGGDFTAMSDRIAARDAQLPIETLFDDLRDDGMHRWTPPGGGSIGALVHVVIHGLDCTVPLGIPRPVPDPTILVVLDALTEGGVHAAFGFDLDGVELRATDAEWAFGSGRPIAGPAAELALLVCGRRTSR